MARQADRVRAYELYEKRGKRDGHALDDWLLAEAELMERKSLRDAEGETDFMEPWLSVANRGESCATYPRSKKTLA